MSGQSRRRPVPFFPALPTECMFQNLKGAHKRLYNYYQFRRETRK